LTTGSRRATSARPRTTGQRQHDQTRLSWLAAILNLNFLVHARVPDENQLSRPRGGATFLHRRFIFFAARALVNERSTKTGKRDRQKHPESWPISTLVPSLGKPAMEYTDRILTCIDCGSEFVFTAGEQLFFHDKQFVNDPKRCKQCKAKRGSGSARVRSETRTTCSECGASTTVPFKPTQGRPVLCRSCFQKLQSGGPPAPGSTEVPS
jgi:CxxC-x17-CxxC domain-containing protein